MLSIRIQLLNGRVYLPVLFICLMKTNEVAASPFASFDERWSSDILSMSQKHWTFSGYSFSPQIASSLSLIW